MKYQAGQRYNEIPRSLHSGTDNLGEPDTLLFTTSKHGRFPDVVTAVTLAPILWLPITVVAAMIGPWWTVTGGVIVTWNWLGFFGLLLTVPGSILTIPNTRNSLDNNTYRRSVIAGLVLTSTLCILVTAQSAAAIVDPAEENPESWLPHLSSTENLVLALPYAAILAAALSLIVTVWTSRKRNDDAAGP